MPSKQPAGGGKGQPQLSAQRESYADIFQRFGQLLKPWNGRCRIRGSRDDNTYLSIITQRECELLKCGARGMSDLEKPDTPAKLLNWIEYLLTLWETLREAHRGDYRPQGYLPVMIANSRVEAYEFAQNLRKARRTLRELPRRTDDPQSDMEALRDWCVTASEAAGEGLPPANDSGHMTATELASIFPPVKPENARKALETWRKNNAGGDGYIENQDARGNEARFTYRVRDVRHIMERLKKLADRREINSRKKSSGKLPAQK